MKREVSEELKKDKLITEFLERNTAVDRMTIRSMAAKIIEKISGNYSTITMIREIPRGSLFHIEDLTGALSELRRELGGKVGASLIFEHVSYSIKI